MCVHLFCINLLYWGTKGAPILFSLLGIRMFVMDYVCIFRAIQDGGA